MRRMLSAVGGCLVLIASSVAAQATISGLVRDSAGHPIAGAEVAIEALNRVTHADETGHFLLGDVMPGMRLLRVRRVGYSPFSRMTQVLEGENKQNDIVLGRVITKLDTVITRDQMLWREDPQLREFAENRKLGLGAFVTRADLEKLRGQPLHHAFAQMLGIRVLYGGSTAAYIGIQRNLTMNPTRPHFEDVAPNGNALALYCYPQVYLDHMLLSRIAIPNVNRFIPEQLEAIEVYRNAAETPPGYGGLNSQCGVVILHTRRPP